MPRRYNQAKRSETAEDTRRRIVKATFDLHAEQGIATTTMKQIAARAGVGVGTVYHHFPRYEDAILACGGLAFDRSPLPTTEIFTGAASRAQRVVRLARALFAFFHGVRAFGSVIADQDQLPVLRPFVELERDTRLALAQDAIGEEGPTARTLAALLEHGTYEAFLRTGYSAQAAADQVAAVFNTWLASRPDPQVPVSRKDV